MSWELLPSKLMKSRSFLFMNLSPFFGDLNNLTIILSHNRSTLKHRCSFIIPILTTQWITKNFIIQVEIFKWNCKTSKKATQTTMNVVLMTLKGFYILSKKDSMNEQFPGMPQRRLGKTGRKFRMCSTCGIAKIYTFQYLNHKTRGKV